MSTDTDHVEPRKAASSLVETWRDWYHIPILGVVMLFMVWTRTLSYNNFVTEDGTPLLAGIDSWYHWRTIEWTAENYPRTMPYEIWSGFPTGTYVGQFGTLFDQLIVTAAMIVGLGDPSTSTLYTVALLSVPVMAALVALPVFFIGRRLGGTIGGLVSIVILALIPGEFFGRTFAGQLQHHVAEVLFMALTVLAMMAALRVAEREKPIYELVVDRDWETLKAPAIYSALAGFSMMVYVWVWPPAIVLIGIFAVFFTVQLCLDYVRGVSPDHVAFVGAVSLGVAAIGTTLLIEDPGISTTGFSYLQPVSAALVAVGCLFMAWFARQWSARGLERNYYPVAIVALIGVVSGALWVVVPDFFGTLLSNLTSRVLPIDPGTGAATIAEAQQPENFFGEHAYEEFGAAFYTMLAGLALLIARPFLGREFRSEYTLIVIWSLFLISMSMTQIRFAYYLALAVAVVNAVFIADIVRIFDLDIQSRIDSIRAVETYQIIVLVMIVMLLFAPLLPPLAGATVIDRGENQQPQPDGIVWGESNEWLLENTPEQGEYAGAGNADEFELYGVYEAPDDGDYDYPEGAYGIMTWWDYGHLITTQAERIPHSNPFQQNARSSAEYLTAESEERGELVLDGIAAGVDVEGESDEAIQAGIDEADESHEDMRYVMIDDQMVSNKFFAITQWTEQDFSYYMTPEQYQEGDSIPIDELQNNSADAPYYNMMQSQLYFEDASGMDHYRLVHENDARTTGYTSYAIVNTQTGEVLTEDLETVIDRLIEEQEQDGVPEQTDEEWEPQIFLNQPGGPEQVAQQYAILEQIPQLDIELLDVQQGSAVKTYERVEGATLTGSVDDPVENGTVTAAVELDSGAQRGSFVYQQDAPVEDDGTFELTVPYATNDELDVEDGYTNSSVDAVDDFAVIVEGEDEDGEFAVQYQGETEVPETAVIDGETIDVEVESVDDPEEVDEPVDDDDDIDPEETDDDIDDGEPDDGEIVDDDGAAPEP